MNSLEVTKYKKYINELKEGTLISERDINVWCDLIELLCLTNPDKVFNREDLERDIEHQIGGGMQLEALKEISIQMGFDIPESHVLSSENTDWGSDRGDKSDLLNQVTNIWFSHLLTRQREYGSYYPFSISKDCSEISCKAVKSLTKKNRLYLYMLIASNRLGLNKKVQKRLEFDFEPISFEAFKTLVPSRGLAFLFGKGKYTTKVFKNKKYDKLLELSQKLNLVLVPSRSMFKPNDTGEAGFDFLGWFDFKDSNANSVIYAGQATCQKEWHTKYYESSRETMIGLLDLSSIGGYINSLFIPYQYRVGCDWPVAHTVRGRLYVLFDRHRILNSISISNIDDALLPDDVIMAIAQ